MRFFVDTNVILEKFLSREESAIANLLFIQLQQQKHELFMSVGGFYTIIYVVDSYLKKELELFGNDRILVLRGIMSDILQTCQVVEHDNTSLLRGITNIQFKDIEDGCQYELAIKADCNYLLTFNPADYPSDNQSTIKVLTPQEYLVQDNGEATL